jgi:hypothetical protein
MSYIGLVRLFGVNSMRKIDLAGKILNRVLTNSKQEN